MEYSGLLSLLVLCILVTDVQGSGLTDWLFPSRCPRLRERCEYKERDACTADRQCQDNKKCCVFGCGKKCLHMDTYRHDICSLRKDAGPCMALFFRWWYNQKSNTCSRFVYGGCMGNNNNFQSKSVCMSACYRRRLSS
nr:eppin-like isoform X2 [Microcebus murinus]